MSDYWTKLKDPHWIAKRNKILRRDNFTCRDCGSFEFDNLQVHHCFYRGEPWEVEDRFLLTLCDECHGARQDLENELRSDIGRLSSSIKPADVERFQARFQRLVFEFQNEIVKFSELDHEIAEGARE